MYVLLPHVTLREMRTPRAAPAHEREAGEAKTRSRDKRRRRVVEAEPERDGACGPSPCLDARP